MRVFHSSRFPNVNKKNYKGIRTNRKRGERKRGRGREKREPRRRRDIKKRNEIKNQKTRGERASSAPISLPPSFRFPAFFPLLQGLFSPLRARASLCRACEPSLLRVSRTAKRPAGGERQSNNQHRCSSGRPLNRFLSLLSLSLCGQAHRSSPPSFSTGNARDRWRSPLLQQQRRRRRWEKQSGGSSKTLDHRRRRGRRPLPRRRGTPRPTLPGSPCSPARRPRCCPAAWPRRPGACSRP